VRGGSHQTENLALMGPIQDIWTLENNQQPHSMNRKGALWRGTSRGKKSSSRAGKAGRSTEERNSKTKAGFEKRGKELREKKRKVRTKKPLRDEGPSRKKKAQGFHRLAIL